LPDQPEVLLILPLILMANLQFSVTA